MRVSKTLLQWRQIAREMALEQFVERHAHPFLVPVSLPERRQPEKASFATECLDNTAVEEAFRALAVLDPNRVIAVLTRDGETFQGLVSVGRATSNDIVVDAQAVSKLHAYFTQELFEGGYCITDSASTNGTFRNGEPLGAKERTLLEDGDLIGFTAEITYRFHTPSGFYDAVREDP